MRKSLIHASLILALSLFTGLAAASPIGDLVGQLSKSDYRGYVQYLEGLGTRYVGTQGNVDATNYVANTLGGFGLTVRRDAFDYGGDQYSNVEATLRGLTTPDKVLIIGAHFDSTSTPPTAPAPGADDNASGTAAMLEIASVFSQYRFDYSIRFLGFNVEEEGLVGSIAYAAEAKGNGDTIVGMLNLDIIAYNAGTNLMDVMGDQWLVDQFIADATSYVPSLLTRYSYKNNDESDQFPFNSVNYKGSTSLLAMEDATNTNPNYHQTTDTTNQLDFDFALKVTQASAATLADLAGYVGVPEPPVALLLLAGLALAAHRRRGSGSTGALVRLEAAIRY